MQLIKVTNGVQGVVVAIATETWHLILDPVNKHLGEGAKSFNYIMTTICTLVVTYW